MKQKLAILGAFVAVVALFAAQAPSVTRADTAQDTFSVKYTACTGALNGCNGDGTVNTNEPVGTEVDTSLADGVGFYDAVQTVFSGVSATGTVPAGDVVGQGSFTIKIQATHPPACGAATSPVPASYTIYGAQDNGVTADYPVKGYAKGLKSGTDVWVAGSAPAGNWIQDFDDDNNNNVPDSLEGGAGANTDPQTTEDNFLANGSAGSDGIPDGVTKEPLYLPLLDQIVGASHTARSFGVAPIFGGVVKVPVDFVTYANLPSAGSSTQLAVIQEGGGLGLLPSDPSSSAIQTCPAFTSQIQINALSSSGAPVQKTAATNGPFTWVFELSTADDWDGDGVQNYQDNCDYVANASQTDTNLDGIGDACTPPPAGAPNGTAKSGTDWDGDGFGNYVDSCPYYNSLSDSDSDGISDPCDPSPFITGNGHNTNPATNAPDIDRFETVTYSYPVAAGTLPASVASDLSHDTNDNHVEDATESFPCASTIGTGQVACDSDGDGISNAQELVNDPTGGSLLVPDAAATRFGTASNGVCKTSELGPATNGDCGRDTTGSTNVPASAMVNMVGDGCDDTVELSLPPLIAGNTTPGQGVPNPANPWGYYTVPVPSLLTPNLSTIPTRISNAGSSSLTPATANSVFAYYKAAAAIGTLEYDQDINQNGVMDGIEYDRSITGAGVPGAPDGTITPADANKAFQEYKAAWSCNSGYQLNDQDQGAP